jgi:hypothetical protein
MVAVLRWRSLVRGLRTGLMIPGRRRGPGCWRRTGLVVSWRRSRLIIRPGLIPGIPRRIGHWLILRINRLRLNVNRSWDTSGKRETSGNNKTQNHKRLLHLLLLFFFYFISNLNIISNPPLKISFTHHEPSVFL